jgi:hypothetical protein
MWPQNYIDMPMEVRLKKKKFLPLKKFSPTFVEFHEALIRKLIFLSRRFFFFFFFLPRA